MAFFISVLLVGHVVARHARDVRPVVCSPEPGESITDIDTTNLLFFNMLTIWTRRDDEHDSDDVSTPHRNFYLRRVRGVTDNRR